MDFALRCNTLKCRAQLTIEAVVTTCSHIFCIACSESSGLASAPNNARVCPACKAPLLAPDDAVRATLDPSEDYKTSVLGGLSPSIILECASRGLAFYTYQTAQEIIYQEFAARALKERNHGLNDEMDRLVQQANMEIGSLREKNAVLQAERGDLEAKNHELADAFRDKCKRVKDMEKLYTTMKQRQDAAAVIKEAEKAARALDVRRGEDTYHSPRTFDRVDHTAQDRSHSRGSADSAERAARGLSKHWPSHPDGSVPVSVMPATPSGHRVRLSDYSAPGRAIGQGHVARQPPHRQPLTSIDPNVYAGDIVNSTHGMSAGLKMGRPHDGTITRLGFARSPSGRSS